MTSAQDLMLQAAWNIQTAIGRLDAAGWSYEAQCLSDDYESSQRSLPDLLMVRDDAERLMEQLKAEEAGQ